MSQERSALTIPEKMSPLLRNIPLGYPLNLLLSPCSETRTYLLILRGGQPPATQPPDDPPWLQPELDHAPPGDMVRRPTSTPSASTRSVLDPDTLSSDSTNSLRAQLRLIREKGLLKAPNSMRTRSRPPRSIYENHIEDLIRHGHHDRYVRKPLEPLLYPKGPIERQIDVIVGGPITRGDNSSVRKAYARAEVQKRPRAQCDSEITFKSENEYLDHDDGLVILDRITNAYVKHIMIDIRSSVI
ncbi:hypothetical protein BHE74_00048036 [Ensete ventricosum]|nr:hypothetical protein GW17_00027952 [Ensete ventricosum]RWW46063.1 hypothetical protein BHE74_00048036 [Ensete ventricosum]RZR94355.1 hypothetical protein BHM03_00023038 [Ensete ventricosum]